MSVTRPAARALLSRRLASATASAPASSAPSRAVTAAVPATCHHFHSSSQLQARRKSRFKSIRAEEMGLVSQKDLDTFTKEKFPAYTPEEKAVLKKVYSPEHMAAIEAGEAAIDPNDLTVQGRLRTDPYHMPYLEDFRDIQPIVDKRPRPHPPPNSNARFMNLDEFTEDLVKWAEELSAKNDKKLSKTLDDFIPEGFKSIPEAEWPPEARQVAADKYAKYLKAEAKRAEEGGPDDNEFFHYLLNRSGMTDNNQKSNSFMAPALPNKVPGVAGLYNNPVDPDDGGLDDTGAYQDLKRRTGMTVRELMDIKVKDLTTRFVSNQTRLGKIRSASVISIAGNRNGWLGIGMAKSTEAAAAREKARQLAIRNMQPVPRYENRTIYGHSEAKVGASIVRLYARPPGFGLRVSHRIFEMARAAGIHDLSAKMPRGRSPMNSVKAAYKALMNQKNPDEVAMARGKKMIDVRKVYYGGSVL